jgi:hypothetical protein
MSKLPKLKVRKPCGYPAEEIRDFEQAKYFLFGYGPNTLVVIEGRVINSYQELIQLAIQDHYKGKEFLEVILESVIGGG